MAKFFGVKENTFINNFRYEVERAREVTKHRLMEAMLENAIQKHKSCNTDIPSKKLARLS